MAVIELQATQRFVKSSFKEGKTPEFYEDTELYYNENAFSSITDAYDDYCENPENDKNLLEIIVLDGSAAVNTPMTMKYISSLYVGDDIEAAAVSKGTIKVNADFTGDIKYFKTVNLTNASIIGSVIGSTNGKSAGAFTAKINKNADADTEYNAGAISGFTNVTLTGIVNKNLVKGLTVNGNIIGGTLDKNALPAATGSLKATNGVDITGDVSGFKTVALTNSSVEGNITGSITEISSGSFTFKVDKNANADAEYNAGAISGFTNVTLTGIVNKNLVKGLTVNGNIIGGTLDKNALPAATGSFKATNGVDITGDVTGFKTVALTNSTVKGSITGSTNGKSVGSFTLKIDKNADLSKDYGVYGDISGFTNVTLTGLNDKKLGFEFAGVGGGICGGTMANEVLTATGTFKATNALVNNGIITGFKTVTLTDSVVLGIDAYGTKGSTVNLTNAVGGYINNVNKVNVKKGISSVGYSGTEMSDTFSIAKNATCIIYEGINLGENDKFVINGTAIFGAGASINTSGVYTISGSGEIAADTETLENIKSRIELPAKSKVKFVDLGAYSDGFQSTTYEQSDNTAKKARKTSDQYISGWLNGDTSGETFSDTIDYIKFTATKDGKLQLNTFDAGESWDTAAKLVLYDTKTKQESDDFDGTVAAGSTYVIGIKCKEETDFSFSYQLGFAEEM